MYGELTRARGKGRLVCEQTGHMTGSDLMRCEASRFKKKEKKDFSLRAEERESVQTHMYTCVRYPVCVCVWGRVSCRREEQEIGQG